MMPLTRTTAAGAALALAATLAGCGGAGHGAAASAPATWASPGSVATRWWSNSASVAGSTIDPNDPEAAVAHLRPSPTDYCGMLRQTLAAGRSILPNVTASDPALLTSTKAFTAELEAVAPPSVAGSWKVLGGAVLALVASDGDPAKVKGIDAAAVRVAARRVAADAKHSCGVDLNSP